MNAWSREDIIIAYALYCVTPLGKINPSNKVIQQVAEIIPHSVASIIAGALAARIRLAIRSRSHATASSAPLSTSLSAISFKRKFSKSSRGRYTRRKSAKTIPPRRLPSTRRSWQTIRSLLRTCCGLSSREQRRRPCLRACRNSRTSKRSFWASSASSRASASRLPRTRFSLH